LGGEKTLILHDRKKQRKGIAAVKDLKTHAESGGLNPTKPEGKQSTGGQRGAK